MSTPPASFPEDEHHLTSENTDSNDQSTEPEDEATHLEQTEQIEQTETQESSSDITTEEKKPTYLPHSTLPQDIEGESNGGPLGCCLGVIAGLFITFLLMVGLSIALANGGFLGIATLPVALLGGIVGGYFGWRIGKRIYRVYEPPAMPDRQRKPKHNQPES